MAAGTRQTAQGKPSHQTPQIPKQQIICGKQENKLDPHPKPTVKRT